jgi:hypothetical protein
MVCLGPGGSKRFGFDAGGKLSLILKILGTGYSTPERTERAYFTKSGIE